MDERIEGFESFEDVERRLQAIVEEVSGDLPLDDALALYEEAAQLGRLACTMSEQDIERAYPADEPQEEGEAAEGAAGDVEGSGAPPASTEGAEPTPAAR